MVIKSNLPCKKLGQAETSLKILFIIQGGLFELKTLNISLIFDDRDMFQMKIKFQKGRMFKSDLFLYM